VESRVDLPRTSQPATVPVCLLAPQCPHHLCACPHRQPFLPTFLHNPHLSLPSINSPDSVVRLLKITVGLIQRRILDSSDKKPTTRVDSAEARPLSSRKSPSCLYTFSSNAIKSIQSTAIWLTDSESTSHRMCSSKYRHGIEYEWRGGANALRFFAHVTLLMLPMSIPLDPEFPDICQNVVYTQEL
jgi:hypothetical protein